MPEQTTAPEFLSTRIPPSLMDMIEKLAEQERRSLSQMTRILLEEAVAIRSKVRRSAKTQ